jgi:uncharacterized protein
MMAQSANLARLQTAYKVWNDSKAHSVDHWMELFHDNASIVSLAGGKAGAEFSRRRTGRSDVRSYFDDIVKDWSMNHYTMSEFIEEGDRIVAIGSCSWTHKKTRKRVDTPKLDIVTFKNGRISQFTEFYDTAKVVAAATGA